MLIAAWTGEEDGLLGSAHWVEHPTADVGRKVVGVVNLDMIGRLGDDGVALDGVASAAEFPDIVKEANARLGLKIGMTAGAMAGGPTTRRSCAAGMPALHLFTGAHADYHRPSDDADKLNGDGHGERGSRSRRTWSAASPIARAARVREAQGDVPARRRAETAPGSERSLPTGRIRAG